MSEFIDPHVRAAAVLRDAEVSPESGLAWRLRDRLASALAESYKRGHDDGYSACRRDHYTPEGAPVTNKAEAIQAFYTAIRLAEQRGDVQGLVAAAQALYHLDDARERSDA